MMIKQHPGTGLWCREDGAVCMPPCHKFPKFRWTYGYDNGKGYLQVKYRGKIYKVHRLVAETFIPNPEGYKEVDHINRDRTVNFVSNLRWADRKMQESNKQSVDDSIERYGVRYCEDKNAYKHALRANNPEFAERERTRVHEWQAKQKELGRHYRTLPDGSRHWLTDAEFNARYKKSSLMAGNSV
jgi:glutaredoxin